MSQSDANFQDQGQGRPELDKTLSEYCVFVNAGCMWGGAEAHSIVGSSIDGSNVAMFTDQLGVGERLSPIVDYEGDEALPALTRIIGRRMRNAGIDNYSLDIERKNFN
jgi:hypothetical protein